MMEQPWLGAMPPFSILGDIWFVGNRTALTHIIDTGNEVIMSSGELYGLSVSGASFGGSNYGCSIALYNYW